MTNQFSGSRPPDGHPNLNAWVTHNASYHEAAHAVAAYFLRYPCLYVELQPVTNGRVGDNAHFVQDLEAMNIALELLNRRAMPCDKAVVSQCTVLEIGRATNVVMNGVSLDQALLNAQCDIEHRDEIFDLNRLSRIQRNAINKQSEAECGRLLRDANFKAAVEAVAPLLVERRVLSDYDVAQEVERVTPLRFRAGDGEPAHSDVQSEAFYLGTRRGPGYGALDNWLSGERGLRFFSSAKM